MKRKICAWLYRHGFTRLAYRISPSITGAIAGKNFADSFREGFEKSFGFKFIMLQAEEFDNIRFSYNHDAKMKPLARTTQLTVDEAGVGVSATLQLFGKEEI